MGTWTTGHTVLIMLGLQLVALTLYACGNHTMASKSSNRVPSNQVSSTKRISKIWFPHQCVRRTVVHWPESHALMMVSRLTEMVDSRRFQLKLLTCSVHEQRF